MGTPGMGTDVVLRQKFESRLVVDPGHGIQGAHFLQGQLRLIRLQFIAGGGEQGRSGNSDGNENADCIQRERIGRFGQTAENKIDSGWDQHLEDRIDQPSVIDQRHQHQAERKQERGLRRKNGDSQKSGQSQNLHGKQGYGRIHDPGRRSLFSVQIYPQRENGMHRRKNADDSGLRLYIQDRAHHEQINAGIDQIKDRHGMQGCPVSFAARLRCAVKKGMALREPFLDCLQLLPSGSQHSLSPNRISIAIWDGLRSFQLLFFYYSITMNVIP